MGVSPRFLSGTAMGEVGLLFGVLYATEFYKQRFYLGGRPEWGIHWRSMVLGMVKWPSLALALLDVLLDRKPAYNTTRKVAATSRDRLVFRHHAPVVVVITFDGDETATAVVDGEAVEIDLSTREGRRPLKGRLGGHKGG